MLKKCEKMNQGTAVSLLRVAGDQRGAVHHGVVIKKMFAATTCKED